MDAARFLAGVEVAKMRGEWTDPRLGRVTVGAWSERWLKAQGQLKPSTRATYESLLRRQVPTWGTYRSPRSPTPTWRPGSRG